MRPESIDENRFMSIKFTEDVVPLTDLKINPGRIVKHVAEVHRPVLLTSRGRGVAVVQSVVDYEEAQEERAFMRAVVEGLADIEAGREVSIEEAKRRLGLR
jgi:prevent-host-death family protein